MGLVVRTFSLCSPCYAHDESGGAGGVYRINAIGHILDRREAIRFQMHIGEDENKLMTFDWSSKIDVRYLLPDFPSVKKAANQFFTDRIRKSARRGSFMGTIPRWIMHEGDIISVKSGKDLPVESEMKEASAGLLLRKEDIIANGMDAYYAKLDELAQSIKNQEEKIMLKAMEQAAEQAQNVVGAKGEFSFSTILDAFEKMMIDFDSNGNPLGQDIILSPSAAAKMRAMLPELEKNQEYKRRYNEIIDRKRKEWLDRENSRRLVD